MAKFRTISCDIETFSSYDLSKCGVYKYAGAPDFEILLFAYSVDGGEVNVVDLANGEAIPQEVINAIKDPTVLKWAFNANFERVCLSKYLGIELSPKSWRCSMVWSAYMGLPLSLEAVGAVLGLEKQKLKEGKELIRYFSIPCNPTKINGERTRNLPCHAPDKWEAFKEYNLRDVEVELAIQEKLSKFPVPENIWDEYKLDQEINDRGVKLDMQLVKNAIIADEQSHSELTNLMKELTDIDNPNSVLQMKEWLADNGMETDSLGKKVVAELLKTAPQPLGRVLELRQQLAKSSVKKYQAMENCVCDDDRVRGMFQFYGANRTGRAAGRLIQCQNLPQNHLPTLEQARSLLKSGNFKALEMLYDSVPDVLSQLIRTAFVPKDGFKFIVADFTSVERVVLAWLAGEKWVLDAYKAKKDLYIATASQMFKVPIEQIDKKSPLRQKGKVADLACIAEGQLVLTDKGLVPIENVKLHHKLWDGEEWVNHEGVIYKGEREVITYEGFTATADHLVWVEGKMRPIHFGIAATSGSHLVQTGNGGIAIRLGDTFIAPTKMQELENNQCKARLYDIQNAGKHHRFTVSGKLVHNCGYGGSVGALKAMGAVDMGLSEDELKPLVTAWRSANPNIVQFWWDVDNAAITAVRDKTIKETHGIKFLYQSGMLFINLPNGRRLVYVKPRIGINQFGSDCVTYEGIGNAKKWERLESYGPKFVENIVQAIARDLLVEAMQRVTKAGFDIILHVHDEIVVEEKDPTKIEKLCDVMSETPKWAKGLVLRADGFVCDFYKKD